VAKVEKKIEAVKRQKETIAPKVEKRVDKKPTHQQPNRIQRYFRETVGELRKVSWPTRQEAMSLTVVVLIVIVVMSAYLGVLDFIFSRFFALILGT
jgi:preprotein translocase subunit SecE